MARLGTDAHAKLEAAVRNGAPPEIAAAKPANKPVPAPAKQTAAAPASPSSATRNNGKWAGYLVKDEDAGCGGQFDSTLPVSLARNSGQISGAIQHLGDDWRFTSRLENDTDLSLWMPFVVEGTNRPVRFSQQLKLDGTFSGDGFAGNFKMQTNVNLCTGRIIMARLDTAAHARMEASVRGGGAPQIAAANPVPKPAAAPRAKPEPAPRPVGSLPSSSSRAVPPSGVKSNLEKLKQLMDSGLINRAQFDARRKMLLDRAFGAIPAQPQQAALPRPAAVPKPKPKFNVPAGINFGDYHALVIGIQQYKTLQRLTTANDDAKAVARVLKGSYGFKVTLLLDPNRSQIIDALDRLRSTLTFKDNLLIYYAGHGWLDEAADQGYWMPVDAEPDRRSNWVSNATITDTLRGMVAKHVMVISDSCYSGRLIRGGKASLRSPQFFQKLARKRARVVITSGGSALRLEDA